MDVVEYLDEVNEIVMEYYNAGMEEELDRLYMTMCSVSNQVGIDVVVYTAKEFLLDEYDTG